ncbi:MAG TPA: hydrogen gas-evolving membrane-bound hydrogenase subunit E, partial [Anaerolineales bacterium]|nr:hydrogen gas-evolving membrane-bound hydrogenase subunit E [Anaerolineales bacterium]
PLTMGFFKDEILFKAALDRSLWFAIAAALNAALTLAYTWRFWSGIFLGRVRTEAHRIPWTMVAPIMILAGLVFLGGVWPSPFDHLASEAASAAWESALSTELAYHLDARLENILALSVYVLGTLLIMVRPAMQPLLNGLSRVGERTGPERGYSSASRWLERGSALLYNFELHDLANRIATVLIPTGVLILIGLWVAPSSAVYRLSEFRVQDIPLGLALLLTALSAIVVTVPRNHLTQLLLLASINFGLAGVFAFFGAPNLALVGVLIGVVSTLISVAFLTLFPQDVLRQGEEVRVPAGRNRRDVLVSLFAGGAAFLVVWRVLSYPSFEENVASKYMELAHSVHAKDVVTAILADWRGLDTMGEVTVLAVILVGLRSFLQIGRKQ